MKRWRVLLAMISVTLATQSVVRAQAVQGIQLFEQHCASCHHAPAPDSRAPDRQTLRQLSTEQILAAMTTGSMSAVSSGLSDTQRRVLAEHLTGRPLGAVQNGHAAAMKNRCSANPMPDPATLPSWQGWGNGVHNTRYQPAPQTALDAKNVSRLTLKWAFGFPGGTSAFAQPAVIGGRLFVGSDIGFVYSLDAAIGCVYWSHQADASVRTGISAGWVTRAGERRHAVFFGDLRANAYAVDSETGQLLWKRQAERHPFARITGTPTLFDGRLFVPLSSFEEVSASNPAYECCTSRGGVVAYDASTGQEIWRSYMVDEPARLGRNSAGTQQWGPSGASVWSAPTVDEKRGLLYVGTGNAYTQPAGDTTDAIVALDLRTGKRSWSRQLTPRDAWVVGCAPGRASHANCPAETGPDFDFGSSPMLVSVLGRDVIAVGQKSGVAWGLDPGKSGAVLWEQRVGRGSAAGGVVWGTAADGRFGYFPTSDGMHGAAVAGGLTAVDLISGEAVWRARPPDRMCGDRPCIQAQAAAITAITGVVFSGTTTGIMRAYSATDGSILWEFDAVREYDTVNGVPARGGSFNGPGPAVAGGMVWFNSGYAYVGGGIPGNVLLAFTLE